jgi:hypothetical protein
MRPPAGSVRAESRGESENVVGGEFDALTASYRRPRGANMLYKGGWSSPSCKGRPGPITLKRLLGVPSRYPFVWSVAQFVKWRFAHAWLDGRADVASTAARSGQAARSGSTARCGYATRSVATRVRADGTLQNVAVISSSQKMPVSGAWVGAD